MSHQKNSTTSNQAQPSMAATAAIHFTCGDVGLTTNDGVPALHALTAASDLAEAIKLFSDRLYDAANDGDSSYCPELFAIGFLAETCSALIRSVKHPQVVTGGAQ